jgi:hypothetical protein
MSWITIARYSLPYEAHLDRARLESEGIVSVIADEYTINMDWLYSNALGGVRLQVDEADQSRAVDILNEDRSGLIDDSIAPGLTSQETGDAPALSRLAENRYRKGFLMAFLLWFIGS